MADHIPMDVQNWDNMELQVMLDETRNLIKAEQISRRLKAWKPKALKLDIGSHVRISQHEKNNDVITIHLALGSPSIEIQDLTKYGEKSKSVDMGGGWETFFVEYRVIKINKFKIHLGSRPDKFRERSWVDPLHKMGRVTPFPPPSGEEDLIAAMKQLDPEGKCDRWEIISWLLRSVNGKETPITDADFKERLEDWEWKDKATKPKV